MNSLAQDVAIAALARHLYAYLPGNPHPYADPSVSFNGVATELGLGLYWHGGSKEPAITRLVELTLRQRPERFSDLIVEIVRRGQRYRAGKNRPLAREDIDELNELLLALGFKIPDLNDRAFLASLPTNRPSPNLGTDMDVATLREAFSNIMKLSPRDRGYAFEKFLNMLFDAAGLAPRPSFRLAGEQIDGSFQLDGDTYLVEATWRNEQVGEEELLSLWGKVHGKAEWSRGVHISYSGYTDGGLVAFARGKKANMVCMDGLDLHDLLDRSLNLREVIRGKVRHAAETNEVFVPVRDLHFN